MDEAATGWVKGDDTGLLIPAHMQALREGGVAFLNRAFRAAGTLGTDNAVTRITRFEECPGGSTGRKVFLSRRLRKTGPRPT